jgi:hypothetical protein
MGSCECVCDLHCDRERLVQRQFPPGQAIRERLALQQFHDEERRAVMLADVVKGAEMRVVQAGNDLGLALESLAATRVGAQFGWKNLDGDCAVEAGVASLVDFSCAVRPDGSLHLILTEACSEGAGHDGPFLLLPLTAMREPGQCATRQRGRL